MGVRHIVMPQLGVNEDSALVAEWLVESGAEVRRGMQIAVLETAKATVELEAEDEGFLYPVVPAGTEVTVQSTLAVVLDRPDPAHAAELIAELDQAGAAPAPSAEPAQLTKRAAALAAQLGIDTSRLPGDRVVTEQDVRALVDDELEQAVPDGGSGQRFVVYGASQGGAAAAEAVAAAGGVVVAFLDDTEGLPGSQHAGLPVWPGAELERLAERGVDAVVTHIAHRPFRLELRDRAADAGIAMPTTVHPAAYVAPSALLGRGNLVKAGAIVDSDVVMGDCCIVDNGAVVPHHNVIGDAVYLGPGVSMGGDCRIGEQTLLGIGAVVSARVTIGRNVIVAPGAVVVRDVPDEVVVEGSPARIVGTRRPG